MSGIVSYFFQFMWGLILPKFLVIINRHPYLNQTMSLEKMTILFPSKQTEGEKET